MKKLVELFNEYKCDKGNIKHRYDRVYAPELERFKDKHFRMLEIGVFKGSSTQAWVDYFPHVEIVALDIFERVNMKDIPILNHARVTPCKCNSTRKPSTKVTPLLEDGFDVIIDDGLHTHVAQRKTFKNFIKFLKENGVYFIEDVWPYDIMSEREKQHFWLKRHAPAFSDKEYDKFLKELKPYNYKYHDLRNGYDPDTFIIEVRK